MTIGSNADDYKEQLKKLSPTGLAWPTDDDSNWVKLLGALAVEYARVDERACNLIEESLPDTTVELLPNWERIAGLPDECSGLGESIQIRRLNLISKLRQRGGQSIAYYTDVAKALGYTVKISEPRPFRVDKNRAGDALYGENWPFAFIVESPLNTVVYFRTNFSTVGEPLAAWGNERLECIINKLKPAHTKAFFIYT